MRLFADTLTVKEVDPDGKVHDDVSRGLFVSNTVSLYLDYHSKLLQCKKTQRVELAIFAESGGFTEADIPEKFHYLMGNGIVYKQGEEGDRVRIEISFSGLLALLNVPKDALQGVEGYSSLYLGVCLV